MHASTFLFNILFSYSYKAPSKNHIPYYRHLSAMLERNSAHKVGGEVYISLHQANLCLENAICATTCKADCYQKTAPGKRNVYISRYPPSLNVAYRGPKGRRFSQPVEYHEDTGIFLGCIGNLWCWQLGVQKPFD